MLAVRRQAARFGWSELVTVVDDVDDAVAFVLAHDPDRRRRRGPDAVVAPSAPPPRSRPDAPVTTAPLRLAASAAVLADDFARVRADLDVPAAFPPDVEAEADRRRRAWARCCRRACPTRRGATRATSSS